MEDLQILWALTITVSQNLILLRYPLRSTLMTVLWYGQGCDRLERTCCDPPNLPWFCKELPQPTTDDLEVRICGDQVLADEDTPIDLVQLYIQ